MEKLQVKGVEVTFDDLTEEGQRSLYLKDKERFQMDAAKSRYSEIRKLVVSETTRLEVLDEVFKAEMDIWRVVDNIKLVWNHENFKRTDDKIQELAKSTKPWILLLVAECEDASSEILNEVLRNEVQKAENMRHIIVEEVIFDNPKFQMEQETLKVLAQSERWDERLRAAKYEGVSSEFLNEMLRNEVQNEEYMDNSVEEAILTNAKFQMEQETLNILKESKYSGYRIIAAESEEISTELLEEMYQDEKDDDVLNAIENNLLRRNTSFKEKIKLSLVQKRRISEILKKVRDGKEKKIPLANYLQEILDIITD